MKLLVCGGRHYNNRALAYDVLDVAHGANHIDVLIHGDARGADALAHDWAEEKGIVCSAFVASWEEQGKAAGPIRNQRMLDQAIPDLVIAFPGGVGTADMVRRAYSAKVRVIQIRG